MFIKKSKDNSKLIDTVFVVANKANAAKKEGKTIINASLGSLYDDDNNLVTFNTVYNQYRKLDNSYYAKYSSSFTGNNNFKEAIKNFVLENKFINLKSKIIATPGGSGAIYLTIHNLLDQYEEIIIPNIGWTSYAIMAKENNLKTIYYQIFDENNNFYLLDLKNKIKESLTKQNKALVVINSPAHNPTGYSINDNDWEELVKFINEDCKDKEVIILNDIAYIDYCSNINKAKNYFSILDKLNSNALVVIAYSCSKAFTYYGMRLGAAILLHKDNKVLDNIFNAYDKSCRSIWSNSNNGAMESVTNILNDDLDSYLNEKQTYINLIKERAKIIINEAKKEELNIYPYNDGFFITLKVDDSIKDKYHSALIDNNIYTVTVDNGVRIAICSLSINECKGLAKKLKEILTSI